jgi:DNA-binding transcriptional ArsR family regulator
MERRDHTMTEPGSGDVSAHSPIAQAVAERLADAMFALSTPSRVLILGCLLAGPRSVSDLTRALGMEQSAVSHQLRVLREHDLVRAEQVGRKRLYALSDEHVAALLHAALHHVDRPHGAHEDRRRPAPGEVVEDVS